MIYASTSFDSFKDQIEPECKSFNAALPLAEICEALLVENSVCKSINMKPFLGYGWITKELSNISDGKMVVCFGDYTKPDGLVDDYSIKSTLNSIKSLIYRFDTPYMNNKAKSSQQLYDAIRPVIETQG